MADAEQIQVLLHDRDEWDRWRIESPGSTVDLRDAQLNRQDFRGINFGWSGLFVAEGDELVPHRNRLERAFFAGSNFRDAWFSNARLDAANLGGAIVDYAHFDDVIAVQARFSFASAREAKFYRADLRGCNFTGTKLENARLDGSDIAGAIFDGADLTSVSFEGVRISRATILDRVSFSSSHDEMADGSESIVLSRFNTMLNWSRLRFISELPIFGVSYLGLVLALIVGHLVGFANEDVLAPSKQILTATAQTLRDGAARLPNHDLSRGAASQMLVCANTIRLFEKSLPTTLRFPGQMAWAVVSTILLAMGSTIYKFVCPHSIQRFTEIEWVAQLRRARLLYVRDSLGCGTRFRRRLQILAQSATAVFVLVGGSIAVVLLLLRLLHLGEVIVHYS